MLDLSPSNYKKEGWENYNSLKAPLKWSPFEGEVFFKKIWDHL